MIKHIPVSKQVGKISPYYSLEFDYMIGDADGDTSEEISVDVDNRFLEPLLRILDKLKPTPGTWGICFDDGFAEKHLKAGQINEQEAALLTKIVDSDYQGDDPTADEYLCEFSELFKCETEYSFLVYRWYYLKYYDEDGVMFNCELVDD